MPLLELYGKNPDGEIDKRVIAGMTGWIIFFPTDTPPDGTLVCNGGAVSRTAYAELFAVLGTKYGAGNGSTTFNLPDLRGKFIRGTGGNAAALGVAQGDAIRNITGGMALSDINNIYVRVNSASGVFAPGRENVGGIVSFAGLPFTAGPAAEFTFNAGEVVPFADENRPVNVALLPCIIYE